MILGYPALRRDVTEHSALLVAQEAGLAGDQLETGLRHAHEWAGKLDSPAEAGRALSSLIDRVQLKREGIQVSIKLLMEAPEGGTVAIAISRWFPMQVKRRGVEMRLVIEGESRKADAALLRVIARAHSWFDDLSSGRVASIPEIAAREKLGERYVRRLVRLAFLAPGIVEAMVAGRQPSELTADRLSVGEDLVYDWKKQQKVLGFELRGSGSGAD